MKTVNMLRMLVLALVLAAWPGGLGAAEPMGCAFTYQGRLLEMGSPAEGEYDFRFKLYDAPMDGNQVDGTVDVNEQWVSDGYFTVLLDFGCDAFNGERRWLEACVRPGEFEDPNACITLIPRQEVTPTPYAIHAATAESVTTGGMQDAIVRGFEIADTENDDPNVTVRPGVAYHGTTKVAKTENTTLTFATASDWYDNSIHPYSEDPDWCYIGYDSKGNMRLLGKNPPDVDDTSGNSVADATKYYFDDSAGTSGEYWRVIGAVRLDTDDQIHANGGGFQRGNLWMWDVPVLMTSNPSPGSWTGGDNPLNCSRLGGIPAISTMGIFGLYAAEDSPGNSAFIAIRPNSSTWAVVAGTGPVTHGENTIAIYAATVSIQEIGGQRICALDLSQQIQYYNGPSDDRTSIDVEGFIMNIR